jgi:hypothetical protein
MTEQTSLENEPKPESLTVSTFGYDLIREILLQELLGKDAPELLYWAGKRIARKFPLFSSEEIVEFFYKASWGNLSIKSESKHELLYELGSELIDERLKLNPDCLFKLEAGFLAQQTELQKKVVAEAFEHPNKKNGKIQFTVKWDLKDPILS